MTDGRRTYLPAAGSDWSLPLYDPLVKLLGGDAARRALIDQAALRPGHRVLEIGCGTGSLLMAIARRHPSVEVTGLDPDPRALARAARKATARSVSVRLDRGFADALPYADASFDRVFSCFMFHHLADADDKRRTLLEARRVLMPGGRLELLDFSQTGPHHGASLMRWLHSNHRLHDNTGERMLSFITEAAFVNPSLVMRARMFHLIELAYYQGSREL